MKINSNQNTLYIDNGIGGNYELEIPEISGWKFVLKQNGAIYYSFSLEGCTQHVVIVTRDPIELERDIHKLTNLLGREPLLDLKNTKLPNNFHNYSGLITMELLFGILAVSSGC